MKDTVDTAVVAQPKNAHLLAMGSEIMEPFNQALNKARATAEALSEGADPHLTKKLAMVKRRLDMFEPSVTLIGQVKAGKTALTNVLAGHVGLLPSDVNPWTSVVTTLHINPRNVKGNAKARFAFFDREEWANLVTGGGRLGELAGRAGANEEMETIQKQIDQMRKQAQSRLGSSFEALLGKVHKYGYCDPELVQRYVCLGDLDELAEDPGNKQGRFADITKAAELYLDVPQMKTSLNLRDTPGVNDTFMVREQITIRALRGSEVCLIVLSAHQALNTTDLALVRLISNFEHRQVILFINRIDELPNPSEQVPEIKKSIMETLDASNAAENTQVLFGSARWAELALTGDFSTLGEDEKAALLDWAKAVNPTGIKDSFTHMWVLSGIPDLMKAINERILEGSGQRLLDGLRGQLANLSKEVQAEQAIAGEGLSVANVDAAALRKELDTLMTASKDTLTETTDKLISELRPRLEKVQESFVTRATEALVQHLNQHGEQEAWTYSSTGLRLVLRSTYARFALVAKKEVADVYAAAAQSVEDVYSKTLGVNIEGFKIEPPVPPRIPPPIVLGKTIALDLSSGWWKKWWQKRKGVENFTEDYSRLIRAEVGSIIQELESSQIAEVFEEMQSTLEEFLSEQRDTILRLSKGANDGGVSAELPQGQEEFRNALGEILNVLEGAAA